MGSWIDLTMSELREILNENGIEYPVGARVRKSDLVELCNSSLNKKVLKNALERFSNHKIGGGSVSNRTSRASVRSVTPVRTRHSKRRPSIHSSDVEKQHVEQTLSQQDVDCSPTQRAKETTATPVQCSIDNGTDDLTTNSLLNKACSVPFSLSPSSQKPHRSSMRDFNNVIVKAGRFSMPSDDIVNSPSRLSSSATRSPQIHLKRRETASEKPLVKVEPCDEESVVMPTQLKNRDRTPSLAQWPAVDPTGAPVRWKIRDPFVFDMKDASKVDTEEEVLRAQRADTPIKRKSKRLKRYHEQKCVTDAAVVRYRWGRIFIAFTVVIGLFLYFIVPTLFPLISHGYEYIKMHWTPLPYCSSYENSINCRPCPENAICNGTHIECRRPQFRKQRSGWDTICVKDQQSYGAAQLLLEDLSNYLSHLQGRIACTQTFPYKTRSIIPVHVETDDDKNNSLPRAGFTREALTRILLSRNSPNQPNGDSQAERLTAELTILFDELIHLPENQERYNIRSRILDVSAQASDIFLEREVYYSTAEAVPFLCLVTRFFARYWLRITSITLLAIVLMRTRKQQKRKQQAISAIKKIVSDNTTIQHLPGNKGYAVGPRAHDVRAMMRSEKTSRSQPIMKSASNTLDRDTMGLNEKMYPEYEDIYFAFNEQQIQILCDDIVKTDAHFCRSVLAMDMIPFYYSKRVIDNLRLQQSTTIHSQQQPKFI